MTGQLLTSLLLGATVKSNCLWKPTSQKVMLGHRIKISIISHWLQDSGGNVKASFKITRVAVLDDITLEVVCYPIGNVAAKMWTCSSWPSKSWLPLWAWVLLIYHVGWTLSFWLLRSWSREHDFIATFYFGKTKDSPWLFLSSVRPLPNFSNDDILLYWIITSLLTLVQLPCCLSLFSFLWHKQPKAGSVDSAHGLEAQSSKSGKA